MTKITGGNYVELTFQKIMMHGEPDSVTIHIPCKHSNYVERVMKQFHVSNGSLPAIYRGSDLLSDINGAAIIANNGDTKIGENRRPIERLSDYPEISRITPWANYKITDISEHTAYDELFI